MKINYKKKEKLPMVLLKVFKAYYKLTILCTECRMHSSFTNVHKKYKYLSRPTKVINVFVNTRVYKQPGLFVY